MILSTRGRIMEATLRLVAQRGFDATAVTDIEADVGLSPGSGSFYRHFRNKEEALQAAVDHEVGRIADERNSVVVEEMGSEPTDRARLARHLRHSLETLQKLRPLIAILARERRRLPDLVAKVRQAMVEGGVRELREQVSTLSDRGGHDDSAAIAAVVLNATVGYQLAADFFGTPTGGVDHARFADALAALVCGAEAKRPAAQRRMRIPTARPRAAQRIVRGARKSSR